MFQIDIHKLFEQFIYHTKAPMIFNSGFFMFLFMGFMAVFFILHKTHRAKITFITLFSYYFYYKSSGMYFFILLLSTVVDYTLANQIYKADSKSKKKSLLIFSLIVNLGLLFYFKYTYFFYSIFCSAGGFAFHPMDIFLPVGVSFFTFQSLSYTIDIYRGTIKPVKNIYDYAFFVSFFPQLVAGPIVRARDFIPQLYQPTFITKEMLGRGIFLITIGLFKKAIISDYISINFVDRIFDDPTLYTGLENLFGVYGYALQIYCDFSGYSDMAIGIALLLGFRYNINFDSPYQSASITEFWRRWHISLSTWLRDYLYISLGGNRKGKVRTYINLMLTMLLGGLWHGASFRYVLWGALHGLGLALDKLFNTAIKFKKNAFTRILGIIFTFHFVCFCWIFFRAGDMKIARQVITQIVTKFSPQVMSSFISGYSGVLFLMALGFILHFIPKRIDAKTQEIVTRLPLFAKVTLLIITIVIVIQVKSSEIQPFIYFQF